MKRTEWRGRFDSFPPSAATDDDDGDVVVVVIAHETRMMHLSSKTDVATQHAHFKLKKSPTEKADQPVRLVSCVEHMFVGMRDSRETWGKNCKEQKLIVDWLWGGTNRTLIIHMIMIHTPMRLRNDELRPSEGRE